MAGEIPKPEEAPTPAEGAARAADSKSWSSRRLIDAIRDRLTLSLALAVGAPLAAAAATLLVVIPTLAPDVGQWDTAEFQTVAPVLGTGHPTGYPSYVILGFVATHILPFGDMAFRMNLLQAILAAGTVAVCVAIVQFLTGMRLVGLVAGLAMLVMPTWSSQTVEFPNGGGFSPSVTATPLLWRLATHADYHMLHVFLVALLFLLLLVWARRRTRMREGDDEAGRAHADRWLVAAAFVYGVAFANHGLAYLLPPAIAIFVLAVAPAIVLQWRLILTCAGVLAVTIVALFAELPIRAAMHASIVYGHPDTWAGFLYVAMGQQFGGIPGSIGADLVPKFWALLDLMVAYLGPLGYVAVFGIVTSLARRPRFVVMSLLAAAATAAFGAAYANADLERYFLVPVFVAFTFVGLGLADAAWIVAQLVGGLVARSSEASGASEGAGAAGYAASEAAADRPSDRASDRPSSREPIVAYALLVAELVAALALAFPTLAAVPTRSMLSSADPAGVSEADQTQYETWVRSVLAPADQGGVAPNAVIVSWWTTSTTLWYGQKVQGLRPDVLILDDSDRVVNGRTVMQVSDEYDLYLAEGRPVYTIRADFGDPVTGDGIPALCNRYVIEPCQPFVLNRVLSRR